MTLAGLIFGLTYAVIVSERIHKTAAALLGGLAMILFRVIDQEEAFAAIDFNVIFLLVGMMVIANITGQTGGFQWLAIRAAKLSRGNATAVLILLAVLTAVGSAFLDNVTTVVLMAPLALFIATTMELKPAPFLITQILASNIGGTATLIGDPPNILIGSAADLDFVDFLVHLGPIILLILVLFLGAIFLFFRNDLKTRPQVRRRVMELNEAEVITDRALLRLCVVVLVGVVAGFVIASAADYEPATVALLGATVLLVVARHQPHEALRDVEWQTIFFFVGLFMVVAGVEHAGLLDDIGQGVADASGGDLTAATMLVLWPGALLSGIVDNIPYTAATIPVVDELGREVNAPSGSGNPLWWALALAAGLGGNLTTVAASANVYVINVAERAGHKIGFFTFLAYGALVTFVSVSIASAYLWLRYLAF
ncbi:MAG TPA: ArsB/NhaD family transporter [Dehalococcoidia bacterium]|nr:ArsB/NhaD family transporter [Dehalococcoidia bacterium]